MLNTSTIDCLVIRLFSCKSVVVLSCLLLDLYFVCRLTEWGINVTWIVVFFVCRQTKLLQMVLQLRGEYEQFNMQCCLVGR